MNLIGFFKSGLFWGYWFPVIVYCTAIFVQSAFPPSDYLPLFQHSDKIMHFLAYAIMGGLFFRAIEKTRPNWRIFWIILLSVLLTTLYGVSDEIHQSFVASRTAEGFDVIADFAGGTFGALCFSMGFLLFE